MKLNELRKFIRLILEEEELLGEPDLSSEEEREDDDCEDKLDLKMSRILLARVEELLKVRVRLQVL